MLLIKDLCGANGWIVPCEKSVQNIFHSFDICSISFHYMIGDFVPCPLNWEFFIQKPKSEKFQCFSNYHWSTVIMLVFMVCLCNDTESNDTVRNIEKAWISRNDLEWLKCMNLRKWNSQHLVINTIHSLTGDIIFKIKISKIKPKFLFHFSINFLPKLKKITLLLPSTCLCLFHFAYFVTK